ncbi:MAG TPA: hypothetical protein VHN14_07595 [Kofleriaceae bacterium]|jgi:hypothetical protein|nr:hypothetical protein [Kofleriaceae bacterium]
MSVELLVANFLRIAAEDLVGAASEGPRPSSDAIMLARTRE